MLVHRRLVKRRRHLVRLNWVDPGVWRGRQVDNRKRDMQTLFIAGREVSVCAWIYQRYSYHSARGLIGIPALFGTRRSLELCCFVCGRLMLPHDVLNFLD